MKVLYISNYKDGTGYAHAACENMLALDAAGVDVVPRAINLNNANAPIPERILELERKSDRGCTICIQHVLPHMLDYRGEFEKNIAIYYSETSHFCNSGWAEKLNLVDEVWVCNNQMIAAAWASGVSIPLRIIPIPTNIEKFGLKYEPLELPADIDGTFKFYTIGEVNRRKNLVAALKAFHIEFSPNEPVSFIIKGSVPGCNPIEARRHLDEIVLQVKKNLKLRKIDDYAREVLITRRLTELEMMQLHAACDCYVAPSYGEAWDIPCFEAMAMGKTPIASDCTGHESYLNAETGFPVGTTLEPVFGMADDCQFAELYTANELWHSVDILELRHVMREAYEHSELTQKLSKNGVDTAKEYSYNKVGSLMLSALRDEIPAIKDDGIHGIVSQVHSMSFVRKRNNEISSCNNDGDSGSCDRGKCTGACKVVSEPVELTGCSE